MVYYLLVGRLERNANDLDLRLEELVVVQPYQIHDPSKDSCGATVTVALSNREGGSDHKYSGLQVEYVELNPFTGNQEDQGKKSSISDCNDKDLT